MTVRRWQETTTSELPPIPRKPRIRVASYVASGRLEIEASHHRLDEYSPPKSLSRSPPRRGPVRQKREAE
jgi:hypothetical protein